MDRELLRVALFLLVGGVQFVLDAGLFVLLTWLGAVPFWANLLARFSAALLGFLLNGKLTFKQSRLGRYQLWKYVLLWAGLTALSTGAVVTAGRLAGLEGAWMAKIVIEILLAGLSFVLMRQWVFR